MAGRSLEEVGVRGFQSLAAILLLLIGLFPSFGFSARKSKQAINCEKLLGLTLVQLDPLEFDVMAGLGLRGFLGAFPKASPEVTAQLAKAGVMYWGHSFAVKRSIEEAREHDAKFRGLEKIMYLISDVDVSDLKHTTPKKVVRERFNQIFTEGKMVYWDDTEAILTKKDVPPKFVQVDMSVARRLIIPETIGYFTRDDRGPRFTQSGWVFPKIRGELNYAEVFESGSTTIKKILNEAKTLARKGYTFTFNQNFQEALNAARDQIRLGKDENGNLVKLASNSRYREPSVYNKALEGYQTGHSFSVEVRDPDGNLVAGTLGERHGNIVAFETVFYTYEDRPDGTFRSNINMAKMAALAGLIRLHEHGIDVADAGMVTPFTAGLKGEYVSAEQFATDVAQLRRRPLVELDLSRPWIP